MFAEWIAVYYSTGLWTPWWQRFCLNNNMEQAFNESWQNKWVRGYIVSLVRCESAQGQGSRPTLLWFPSLVHCFSHKTTQGFIEWNIRTRGASEIRSKEEKRVTTWTSFATAGKKAKYNSEQAVCQPEENQRQVTGNIYSVVTPEYVKIFPFLLLKYKNLINSFLMNNYCFFPIKSTVSSLSSYCYKTR